ncbi:ECF RNA polymerase sigma factor SigE [Gemmata obscuriglobus]|uniref:ECF RNA polymerase sigma factor SigE n=1 Tax=Gemmata obscuriglobus TaxID=114 RepID=A0A2Z3H9G1_9BACT|nr:sigma-70 family RNA polymerase sigma factor [Gemmata obscuriglobus]AWM39645.1 hypothetical protein C1280_23355 [Gemmata obscuriglobus]QEG27253.1 ECF RNA polymerase sigma factor SigE [Gemmata obscuriglobus]VTS04022.1 sigma-70 family rna polymerase sigma factor : RNA polymerase sigma factor, sigma-70 family OS=Singulisphaera acidiphila (strain ATCC BAA-1392 / DSM 18658 / VKM B-2454 / MOB10) GN=Sinac_0185 PE=4 SV=1: Sigma70_r2: Sigma70_r4_2 [Gemmata obscuriglobus UQM 2246]
MSHRTARFVAALVPERELPTDAELLARFAAGRDAGAFELLVWRHAGLVLRVCRAALRDRHAAEDAAQAVFLALARQAGSVGRSGTAAGWLFRVSRRVSARAARRRVAVPVPASDLDALPAPDAPEPDRDAERAVQEEVARLPESHRAPVLLCFFEGLTHAEAARRLGVPVGTVAGRIARAKEVLAVRLRRRGLSLAVLPSAGVLIVPAFVSATAHIAITFAAEGRVGVPGPVLELVNQELRVMALKRVLGGAAALVLVVAGACLSFGMSGPPEPPAAPTPAPHVAAEKPPAPKVPAPVIGKAFAIAPITTDLQRQLIRGAGADSAVLLIVDAQTLLKDDKTLDVGALQLAEMRKGLRAFRRAKGQSVAHSAVHYPFGREISGDSADALDFVLAGAARAEEFAPVTPLGYHTVHNQAFDFVKYISPLKEKAAGDTAEVGVGDERVVAYPVRTPLSQVLTGSVSGVLIVKTPVMCQGDVWQADGLGASVRGTLEKLKLAKGSRVYFSLNVQGRNPKATDQLRLDCAEWAKDAGLELWQTSY